MRIITGRFKGRILTTVRDLSVRPATDRVKSTIYNTLQSRLSLDGISVLDLFAGSGSLGFEALSRGAASVVFVENNRNVLDCIRGNAAKLGCEDECTFFKGDADEYVRSASATFGLVFVDPPYADGTTAELPSLIFGKGLVAPGGYVILEHTKRTIIPPSDIYRTAVVKEFGATIVSFCTHPS